MVLRKTHIRLSRFTAPAVTFGECSPEGQEFIRCKCIYLLISLVFKLATNAILDAFVQIKFGYLFMSTNQRHSEEGLQQTTIDLVSCSDTIGLAWSWIQASIQSNADFIMNSQDNYISP